MSISIQQGLDFLKEIAEQDPEAFETGFQAGVFGAKSLEGSVDIDRLPAGEAFAEGIKLAISLRNEVSVEVSKTGSFAVGGIVGWLGARNGRAVEAERQQV